MNRDGLDVYDAQNHEGDLRLDTDVVVVGSGAGGSVVATELAGIGQQVIVLEEGKHVPSAQLGAMRPSQSLRHVWRDGGMTVALGLGDSPAINVTMGKCIGGSSVLTGGVCFRTPEPVLHEWTDRLGLKDLSPERMEPHFNAVEKAVHVQEVPVAMRSRSTALFGEGLARRGLHLEPLRRNTDGCKGCGRCNFGCPHGAKLSVDLSYLPRAIAAGAQVYSHCRVERILVRQGRAVGVAGRLLNGPGGRPRGTLVVYARRVVVAAGAVHSSLLLKRSGIGKRSGQVGRNMTLHPSFRVFARFDDPVDGWRGALQSAYCNAYMKENITLMSVFVPPGIFGATMPGIGAVHSERTAQLPYLAMFGGLIHDDGGGAVHRVPGREPVLTYRMSATDRAAVPKVIRMLAEIFFDAGAKEMYLPVLGHEPVDADGCRKVDLEHIHGRHIECSSQHPLGTCRMGISADSSVVDPTGQSWEVQDLYLSDGSVVPTSLGVNPQITIMTMATRIAALLKEKPLPDMRA